MATFTVSSTTDLRNAITAAGNGDSILLATGSYSGVTVSAVTKTGTVTIASADPDHPAILTDLVITNSAGLAFRDLELSGTRDMPFQVYGSSRIVLDRLDIHGTLNGTSSDDYRGLLVRESNTVTVSNSHFHELTSALTHINSQNLSFTGNSFDTIRDDGIAGGGSSNVTIARNSFTNFDHVGETHPDAIQFWTANTTTAATDITVTGNVFTRGTGSAVQGIFMADESGTLPYRNVVISNNVVIGGAFNGIAICGAASATLAGNIVIGTDDQASWLGTRNVMAALVADNQATSFNFANSSVTSSGNVQASLVTAAAAAQLSAAALSAGIDAALAASAVDLSGFVAAIGGSLIGFIDSPSTNGLVYQFSEVRIDGTAGADRLAAGTVGASHLYGYDGNDSLAGSRNGIATTLEGGRGDDTYIVYQAGDQIVELAGEGTDTVSTYVSYTLTANVENLRSLGTGLTLRGNAGANALTADAGGSVLYGEGGDDALQGSTGADRLFGGDGNDRLSGGVGDDLLDGGAGNDTLGGGDGSDTIYGGGGNDSIEGGTGADSLTGGDGADGFVFRNGDCTIADPAGPKDTITDFRTSDNDRISLTMIDANTKTAADDAFSFIGSQAFHRIAGELRYEADGDGITLTGDTDGDGIADIGIHLTGLTAITASNLYL